MPPSVAAGTVVAGFRVESLLGEGAMGAVYLAEEIATGRRVALGSAPVAAVPRIAAKRTRRLRERAPGR